MPSCFYQPTITRLPSLLCLFILAIALIALTEIAIRRLPAHENAGFVSTLKDKTSDEVHGMVQARHAIPDPQEDFSTTIAAPPPSDYLRISATPTIPPIVASAPPISDYLGISAAPTTSPIVPSAAPPSNYLPVEPGSETKGPTAPTSNPLRVNPSMSFIVPPPASTAYLPIDSPPVTSPSQVEVGAPLSSNYLPLSHPIIATLAMQDVAQTGAPDLSNTLPLAKPSSSILPIQQNTQTTAFLPTLNAIHTVAGITAESPLPASSSAVARTGELLGEQYSIEENGWVVVDGTRFQTSSPTTATLKDGHVLVVEPTGAVSIQASNDNANTPPTTVTPQDYVLGSWVPTVLAVVFSIPWHLLASAIKEMEPFYQLHNANGALAKDSISLEYSASISVIATFTAMRKKHYLVWWSGLMSLIILLVPPLASETVFLGFTGTCTATSGRSACYPQLSVFPATARVVQGTLAFIAVMTLVMAIAITRRKSGVYANPRSIATLASLFQDQHLVEECRQLNSHSSSSKDIRIALDGNRYRIGAYSRADGTSSYGLILVQHDIAQVEYDPQTFTFAGKKYTSVAVQSVDEDPVSTVQKSRSNTWVKPAMLAIFTAFVAGLEVLVIYYNRTGGDTDFERFMNSNTFGVSFLFTAIGVILKMYWTMLDEEIRSLEPYRQLLHGEAKADDSILLTPHSNPFTGFFHSLAHRHLFNSYISFVAILCEPLIVALANIPFKPGSAFLAYTVATWTTVAVLLMMLVGIVWMLCRKRTPSMIRKPDTIADVLLMLCGSHMLRDFQGMALMDSKVRDKLVRARDKRYAMGRLIGEDGVERVGVDENIFIRIPVR